MPKRTVAEAASTDTRAVVVNLSALPEPAPDGRKARSVLKREQLESELRKLGDGWPGGAVEDLVFNPLELALKWKFKDVRLLESALRGVGSTLQLLSLSPSATSHNTVLPASTSALSLECCPRLHTLRLREVLCAHETIGALGKLTNLREVELGGICINISAPLDTSEIGCLCQCAQLETLVLTDTDIADAALALIAHGCKQLTRVDLSSSRELRDAGVQALGGCSALERLSLLNCRDVGPQAIRALAACTQLRKLDLQRVRGAATTIGELCKGCSELHELSLCCCSITDEDLAALPLLAHLKSLNLNGATGGRRKSARRVPTSLHRARDALAQQRAPVAEGDGRARDRAWRTRPARRARPQQHQREWRGG
jgi:hypothetical protein